ncbi:MAG: carbon-nitrogen hydrolase family protein, partial [Afipia sp.]|nr:carbon-nitrogen hydrolase family protein [Afipia sp.]
TGAPFTAAMVQMRTALLPEHSLAQGIALIREAKDKGADYVLTPEVSNMMQENRKALFEHLASEEDDLSLKAYRELARELKIYLHIGSLYQAGETAVISDLPWGRLGLTICYDVRFPALYRALAEAGASFITVPSAFTKKTGEAHWHTLLRARAIENGCFIFAAAQGGTHENKRETFGHSLIIDPWGEILAESGTEPGVVLAKIDPAKVQSVRKNIPSLQHGRRFGLADPKAGPEHLHLVRGSA